MIVKALALTEQAPPGRAWSEWDTQDFRDGVRRPLVVAGLVSFDWRIEEGEDIVRAAMSGEKHFQACPRGLDRFNEDEFVLVRNDHRRVLTIIALRLPNTIVSFCLTNRNPEFIRTNRQSTARTHRGLGQAVGFQLAAVLELTDRAK